MPAGMRTYNDAGLTGTPVKVSFSYEGDENEYWWKAYPAAAAEIGGSDNPVQDDLRVMNDGLITGVPSVIGVISHGSWRYWKAYLTAADDIRINPPGIVRLEDGAVSGTPRLLEVQCDGQSFFFKVYPDYGGNAPGWITDLPVRVCNRCGAVWTEDEKMYEEEDRCPVCGVRDADPEYEGAPDPDVGGWV